jgi:acetolactate synthase-1/2/3 large subunit
VIGGRSNVGYSVRASLAVVARRSLALPVGHPAVCPGARREIVPAARRQHEQRHEGEAVGTHPRGALSFCPAITASRQPGILARLLDKEAAVPRSRRTPDTTMHQPNPTPANDAALAGPAPAARTTADALVQFLFAAGIRIIFGIPGGPLMAVYNALFRLGLIRHVLIGCEQNAPFFAYGYWCAANVPAAICATAGSVSKKLANGLGCARADYVPMFAITAQATEAGWGCHGSQDGSPWAADSVRALASDTAASALLARPEQLLGTMTRLVNKMYDAHQPVLVSLSPEVAVAPAVLGPVPPPHVRARPVDLALVRQAARLLARTRRRAILVGSGALLSGACPEIARLVQRLQVPVASTPRAAWLPGTPYDLGIFGLAGSPLAEAVILSDDVEVLLVIGSRLGELSTGGWDPRLARKQIIQIDLDPDHVVPRALGVVGDARATVAELLAELDRLQAAPGAEATPPFAGRPGRYLDPASLEDRTTPIKPQLLVGILRRLLPADALTFADVGNAMGWLLHYLPRTVPQTLVTNLGMASMGHALPAAVGAKLARPDMTVVAVLGDGAWRMSGTELFTAVEHDVAPLVIVLNSGSHAMVVDGADEHFDGQVPSASFRGDLQIAEMARAMSADAVRIEDPEELEPAIAAGLRADRATLIEVMVDRTQRPPMGARMRALSAAFGQGGGGR